MKKVKLKTRLQSPDYNQAPGSEVDLPDVMADQLVSTLQAEYVGEQKVEIVGDVVDVEKLAEEITPEAKVDAVIDKPTREPAKVAQKKTRRTRKKK